MAMQTLNWCLMNKIKDLEKINKRSGLNFHKVTNRYLKKNHQSKKNENIHIQKGLFYLQYTKEKGTNIQKSRQMQIVNNNYQT